MRAASFRSVYAAVSLALTPLVAQSPIAAIVPTFVGHDLDGDGVAELRTLELLHEIGKPEAPLVVVLVEARLLRPVEPALNPAVDSLRERLLRHAADLANEGFRAAVVAIEVHSGPPHQDGRTVLALRRLLQALQQKAAPLAAAVLVGHFPDALLVRTCNWRRNEPLELLGHDGKAVAIAATQTNVRTVPEVVAHRCDIVLADLDGAWEQVYLPGPVALPSVIAVFGDTVPAGGGTCLGMREGQLQVTDVFHTADGTAVVDREKFAVVIDDADRDHECTAADRQLGNPLAQAEIAVSRIDARGAAWQPDPRAIDAQGRPQALGAGSDRDQDVVWHADFAFELRLLGNYFDRNHAFRSTPLPAAQHKPASISHGLGSGLPVLRAASPAWREFAEPGYDCSAAVDLTALTAWLQRPAVLRTLRAHSDPYAAAFDRTDPAALERTVGGPPWRWHRDGQQLVPSLRANGNGRADWWFYRSLFENHVLPDQPYLLVHTGCEALSPPGACEFGFDDPRYGRFAHAEAMLFFTPCLAMVGRAKVFYDEPRGFCEALAAGATFGDAWRRYFVLEGAAANWGEVGDDIGRKRAYFWSVVGDCTLRLPRGE